MRNVKSIDIPAFLRHFAGVCRCVEQTARVTIMTDSRKRTRVDGNFRGELIVQEREVPIATENLSLKGMLCTMNAPEALYLRENAPCTVRLHLAPGVSIDVECAVVRQTGDDVALDFVSMDEESYMHLRNIVRFSAADPDAIDTEQALKPFAEDILTKDSEPTP